MHPNSVSLGWSPRKGWYLPWGGRLKWEPRTRLQGIGICLRAPSSSFLYSQPSLSTQQVPSHSFQPPLSKLVSGEEAGTSLQQGGDVSSSSPRGRVASYTADKKWNSNGTLMARWGVPTSWTSSQSSSRPPGCTPWCEGQVWFWDPDSHTGPLTWLNALLLPF